MVFGKDADYFTFTFFTCQPFSLIRGSYGCLACDTCSASYMYFTCISKNLSGTKGNATGRTCLPPLLLFRVHSVSIIFASFRGPAHWTYSPIKMAIFYPDVAGDVTAPNQEKYALA